MVLMTTAIQAAEAEKVLSMNLDVYKNDSVIENRLKIEEGNPTFYVSSGDYILEILGVDGSVIASESIGLKFLIYTDPPSPTDYSTINLRIAYVEGMKKVRLYNKDKLIYAADIAACVINGLCEPHETYVSCPRDCTLDKKDGICVPRKEGVCDPDCAPGTDPDCSTPATVESCNNNGLCEPHLGETAQDCPQDCGNQQDRCRREGETIKIEGGQRCCSDLKALGCARLGGDGGCVEMECKESTCERCGDGVCTGKENRCNCPEDCGGVVKTSTTEEASPTTQQEEAYCGDGVCESSRGESRDTCQQDCPKATGGLTDYGPYITLFAVIIIITLAVLFYKKMKNAK